MAYTNKGLVEYAKKCLALGNDSIYLYGSFGNTLSEAFISQKAGQYVYNISRQSIYKKCLKSSGTEYAFDCVGLIKSYYWGGYGKVKYNGASDESANSMYNESKVKGDISTIPEKAGVLVWMSGHIGIYIGDGYVIECTPTKKFAKQDHGGGGVCKTKLTDRKWKKWCECPYITYTATTTTKAKGTITINSGTWNVRKGAGTSYEVVRVVKGGTKLNYYSTSNGWYKIDGGYISPKAVKGTGSAPTYYKKYTGTSGSIVVALKSIGVDSSFSYRKKIAKANGIKLYVGSSKQNIELLTKLKTGKLIKI